MQHHVGAARRFGDRRMVERIELADFGALRACAAAPGRTRLATVQPASRNASAAKRPKRPAAPSTKMRELMLVLEP